MFMSPEAIPNETPVGKLSDQITNEKVAAIGAVVTSRPIELSGKVVDHIYAVKYHGMPIRLHFHHELTTAVITD